MEVKKSIKRNLFIGIVFGLVVGSLVLFFNKKLIYSLVSLILSIVLYFVFVYFKESLARTERIKKIENVFPDFLQLMSSNLRAGMTIDRAMLLSSRPEFSPLDEEILKTGKDITVGKVMEIALIDMSKRINSKKINKIILLINSGIRSGGDLAILLEETSRGMRDRAILEKKAASNVLMYVIFIFLAVSFFAPALFSLSNVLVEVLTNIFSGIPEVKANINMPFVLSKINLSTAFVFYFSISFMMIIDLLACLILGLISKGEEKQGLKFFPIIAILSLGVFFITRVIVSNFVGSLF